MALADKHRLWIAASPLIVGGVVLLFRAPIPQPTSFHDFADRRTIFGIPNFMDVITNIPFFVIGLFVARRIRTAALPRDLKFAFAAFAATLIGTFLGSSAYHLDPSTPHLVYDRIPLSMLFASIFALIVRARTRRPFPPALLGLILALAAASVLYWAWTESLGRGDLRGYLWIQFGGMLAMVFVLVLYAKKSGSSRPFITALLLYAGALVLQDFDRSVFERLGGKVGGHALKHLVAAWAARVLAKCIERPQVMCDAATE